MANYLDKDGLLYFWQRIKNIFAQKTELPTKTSDLTNDSNFVTDASYVHTDNNYTTSEKTKLSGIEAGAEVNQNAFGVVCVRNAGGTISTQDIPATGESSTFNIVEGSNMTLEVTQAGYLKFSSSYSNATQSSAGLMSASDKIALDSLSGGTVSDVKVDGTSVVENSVAIIPLASSSSPGAMSSSDKTKLDGFSAASNYALKSDITGMYKYKGSVATASLLPTTGQTVGDVYDIQSSSIYGAPGMNVAWDGTDWDPLGEIFTITSVTNAEIDTIVAS